MLNLMMFWRRSIRTTTRSIRCMIISDYVSTFRWTLNWFIVEYKRKVYLEQKRDKSESPVRHSISTGSREIRERTMQEPLSPNKNFMTHLPATSHDVHASIDTTAQYLNEKISSNRKRAARNANVFNITAPSLQSKGGRYSTSRFTSQ